MTANVRAITIRQPYARAIVKKGKRIENRTWSTKSRGDLFIHAAPDPPRGVLVAMCRLVDVVTESDEVVRG